MPIRITGYRKTPLPQIYHSVWLEYLPYLGWDVGNNNFRQKARVRIPANRILLGFDV
jgi:hypothetical protein